MKFFKKLVLSLLAIMIVLASILWVFSKTLNPEVIKDYVNTQLTTLTSQPSTVEGDISWQLFPRPGIKISSIKSGNFNPKEAFSLKIDNLLFNLKLSQLLRGRLVFSELKAKGLTLQINTNLPATTFSSQQKGKGKAAKSSEINFSDQFAIDSLMISHSQITWLYKQNKLTLSDLQLGAERVNLQQEIFPFQIKTNLEYLKADTRAAKAHLNFKGNTKLSPSILSNPQNLLTSLTVSGQLTMFDILLDKLKINRLSANTQFKENNLQLNPLALSLYHGESSGDFNYIFDQHKISINQTATNLDSSKLISDLLGKKLIKGSLDISLHSETDLDASSWQEGSQGKGNLTIKDGALLAVNFNRLIEEINLKINKLINNSKSKSNNKLQTSQFDDPAIFKGNTPFKLLTFEYQIAQGLLTSEHFVLQADRLQLKGKGQIQLKDLTVNSRIQAKVAFKNEQSERIQQLLGGAIPILLEGTLNNPIIVPDLKQINPALTQEWLKNTLEMPVKQIKKHLNKIFS